MDVETGKELLEVLLGAGRKTLEAMNEDGEGFAPMMTYATMDKKSVTALMVGDDSVQYMVKRTLIEMHRRFGEAEWIAFTSDAYYKNYGKVKPTDENYRHGDFKEMFEEGDVTVSESLVVSLTWKDGCLSAFQPHRYIPSEGMEWDEPVYADEDSEGGMVDAIMKAFFKAQEMSHD